jgi:N-hydroxyarylamine O-acetyltransferase
LGEIDLDAYFERIGHAGSRSPTLDTLQALHLRHPSAIPFESLNPLLGRPVAIDPEALQAKLVARRRGGYCFEQNGLFLHVLTALGFQVTPLAARVRWMLPDDAPQSPLSHMLLKVELPEGPFICDVGFGSDSPTAPLRFEHRTEQRTPHGDYRILQGTTGWDVQTRLPEGWALMYRFRDEPQSPRDYEVFNWFTATHPDSRFVNNLIAARVVGDRRAALFNDRLAAHWPDGKSEKTALAGPREAHQALADIFGIDIDLADIEGAWDRLPKEMLAR